jgi:hypothetical protein
MNAEEKLILQGFKISIESLGLAIRELRASSAARNLEDIPEWVNLETAATLKGGPALATYQTKLFLQPCCGRNYKLVGGRKCWHRDFIIPWLAIDDSALKAYADEWKVNLPEIYAKRSA